MIIFKSFSLYIFLQFGRKYYYEWINAAIIVLVMCMSSFQHLDGCGLSRFSIVTSVPIVGSHPQEILVYVHVV